jgi:hypothetical protein
MRVRIRLQRRPNIRRELRKDGHIALASAALLTPAALVAFILSLWRLGGDLGFARSFAIETGIFSHWQVWLAISVGVQFTAVVLNRYGNREVALPNMVVDAEREEQAHSLVK